MGSNGDVVPPSSSSFAQDGSEEINVLVTGFGPFNQRAINPSWEIAKALPPFLPAASKAAASSSLSISPRLPPVRILTYPSPIRVSYQTVCDLIPSLWGSNTASSKRNQEPESQLDRESPQGKHDVRPHEKKRVDFMIHIGMASGRKYYSVERNAHRDGYTMEDVDGEIWEDMKRRMIGEGVVDGSLTDEHGRPDRKWCWEGLPTELSTDIDIDDVWTRWRGRLPESDLRISNDAGRYLCDFIYYSSLAELTRRVEEKRVLFFHVPIDVEEDAIQKGVSITLELIRAVVESNMLSKDTIVDI